MRAYKQKTEVVKTMSKALADAKQVSKGITQDEFIKYIDTLMFVTSRPKNTFEIQGERTSDYEFDTQFLETFKCQRFVTLLSGYKSYINDVEMLDNNTEIMTPGEVADINLRLKSHFRNQTRDVKRLDLTIDEILVNTVSLTDGVRMTSGDTFPRFDVKFKFDEVYDVNESENIITKLLKKLV